MNNRTRPTDHGSVTSAVLSLAVSLCAATAGIAQTPPPVDLSHASLEDLMHIQVTSVSKKEQTLSKTPSAIYVIGQDDIRRSGATNIPDLLRMAPGVNVARISGNTWAISIRGFNSQYSSKVLVLIDGRSVYTPLFSGVFWDLQNIPVENIERIEVIRGPGSTVWGANAMNGVINVITKSSTETRGGLFSSTTGTRDHAQELMQYGGATGPEGSYRVYGRYSMNGDSPSNAGIPGSDSGHSAQTGFRYDSNPSPKDRLTVQGDLSRYSESLPIRTLLSDRLPDYYTFDDRVRVSAGNALGRWEHKFQNDSAATVQVYYDRFRRSTNGLEIQNTIDFDGMYHFRAGNGHDLVTGFGYRFTAQSFTQGYSVSLGAGHRRDGLFNSFVQDEITLTRTLALTVGVKVEHNAYTGFEVQPSLQLAYVPSPSQTIWASVSRAIEQPSWAYSEAVVDEAAVSTPTGQVAVFQIRGSPLVTVSSVYNYELGYRVDLSKRATIDTSVFINDYDHVPTLEPRAPLFVLTPAPPHLILPNVIENLGKATSYGAEAAAQLRVADWWRVNSSVSYLQLKMSLDPSSRDITLDGVPRDSPKYQAAVRSSITLPHKIEWTSSALYVSRLGKAVPAYTRFDTRLAWMPSNSVEISAVGQNLLTPHHLEFLNTFQVVPRQVGREVLGKVTWRF